MDDFEVLMLAMKNRVPIRGTKNDLLRALAPDQTVAKKKNAIMWRTFVRFFLWKLGGPYNNPVNDVEYCTGANINTVSPYYLFSVAEAGHQYHYDIRTVTDTNIYTTHPFDAQTRNKYNLKIKWLLKFGFPVTIETQVRSIKQYIVCNKV